MEEKWDVQNLANEWEATNLQPENSLKVKKLVPEAKLPSKANITDAGYDVVVIDNGTIELKEVECKSLKPLMKIDNDQKLWRVKFIEYRTGLAIEPPKGYHMEIVARSSVSRYDLILANCTGIADNGYRGEYKMRFRILPLSPKMFLGKTKEEALKEIYEYIQSSNIDLFVAGDKAGQLLLTKTEDAPIVEVKDLTDTSRGTGGFGSTGQ